MRAVQSSGRLKMQLLAASEELELLPLMAVCISMLGVYR